MNLRPLPAQIRALLETHGAPPRLIAHLTLVHDVMCRIIAEFDIEWPTLQYDRDSVLIGASTHDIGKIEHTAELSRPGHAHEAAGVALLLSLGYSQEQARFARTHAEWVSEPRPQLEDLLIALADSWWRGKRDTDLESAICQQVAAQTTQPRWQVFLALDTIANDVTAEAEMRLAWQSQHSI